MCVCESYIGKPIGTRAVPQFTTGVAKPLTQIEPGKNSTPDSCHYRRTQLSAVQRLASARMCFFLEV